MIINKSALLALAFVLATFASTGLRAESYQVEFSPLAAAGHSLSGEMFNRIFGINQNQGNASISSGSSVGSSSFSGGSSSGSSSSSTSQFTGVNGILSGNGSTIGVNGNGLAIVGPTFFHYGAEHYSGAAVSISIHN